MKFHFKNSSFLFSFLFVISLIFAGCSGNTNKNEAKFVGYAACISCHQQETNLWKNSDHDMAMRIANQNTVKGDFDNKTFTHFGVTSKFYKRNGKYYVYTEGEKGVMQEFEIKYTFGIRPLQQYLIEFPGGKLQTLPLCWDTRPKEEGGQRWFHIYDKEKITPNDQLYWTGVNQNWNYMCAECHSTNLKKNYDPVSMEYHTTWKDIDVACEACHGPGSEHIKWGREVEAGKHDKNEKNNGLVISFKDFNKGKWILESDSLIAYRTAPVGNDNLIESCARCHSLRTTLSEDYHYGDILLQSHRLILLENLIYYPDGQILGEDYVYGSFIQSKMYQAGVRCRDCHDVHSLNVFTKSNDLCLKCHQKKYYDSPKHHFHKMDSKGSLCVECHMTQTNYMVIDARRDHSFQIPRPDLSEKLNSPNACNKCHKDKTVKWAADAFVKWYGEKNDLTYGEIIFEGRRGNPDYEQSLIKYIENKANPAIRRATAVTVLRNYYSNRSRNEIQISLNDKEPLVRMAGLSVIDVFEPVQIVKLALPLLSDSVRAVRFEAMRKLVTVQPSYLSTKQIETIKKEMDEFDETQRINADRPETHLMWGLINSVKGNFEKAESAYNLAIKLDSSYVLAYINLADLYRSKGEDDKGERILKKALKIAYSPNRIYYALGLLYSRQKRYDDALKVLKQGFENDPADNELAYIYAIALNSNGMSKESLEVLEQTYKLYPYDPQLLIALATINRDLGNYKTALKYTKELIKVMPDNQSAKQLRNQLNEMRD